MKNRNFIESFNNAIEGIVSGIREERNLKIHVSVACLVIILAIYFRIPKIEWLILFITIFLVIFAEMVNTAIESVSDAISKEYNILIKQAKDLAAGAVLIVTINAVIVGTIIFGERVINFSSGAFENLAMSKTSSILIDIAVVVLITIFLKVINGNKSPMRGGMPSAHAMIGFSLATIISYFSDDHVTIFLALILAFLVSQSRVEGKIHSIKEVVIGGVLGILITIVVLKISLG